MFIPASPQFYSDAISGRLPVLWYGTVARDGDASPWKDAPIGSIYIANVAGTLTIWVKDANAVADADWGTVDITT